MVKLGHFSFSLFLKRIFFSLNLLTSGKNNAMQGKKQQAIPTQARIPTSIKNMNPHHNKMFVSTFGPLF